LRVQVVFLADVLPRYRAGDVRFVAGGYARNYLIPKGLAAPATQEHLKRIEKIRQAADERRAREAQETQGVAQRLEGMTVTIKARAGEGGRLYGSITTAAIAQAITDASGQEVDRRLIQLPEPIRSLGSFPVAVRLHQDIVPSVTVVVEAEGQRPAASSAPAEATAEAETEASAGAEEPAASEPTPDDGPAGEPVEETGAQTP
jgi:large subunit ribosomal protein L9